MRFESLIALRYLRSRRSFNFVTVISLISVIGIMIGVAALIVVLAVFNGFSGLVTSMLTSFDPHLRIEATERLPATQYDSLLTVARRTGDVAGESPVVMGKALVIAHATTRVVTIKGMDPASIDSVSGLRAKIVLGELALGAGGTSGVVIGTTLADRLGVVTGDTLSVVSPVSAAPAALQFGLPMIRRFRITGMYESNNKDYDSYYAFVNLAAAQTLFQTGDAVDGVEMRMTSIHEAGRMKTRLQEAGEGRFRILTWFDLHRELYTVMQIERWAAYVILSLIIAVASFNLLGSLTMTVIEKTRDIGVLKAMGAPDESIARIFRTQGFVVGVIGTIFGAAIGLGVVALQDVWHLFPLDPTVYIIDAIPVEVRWYDIIAIAVASLGLSALASRLPAARASRLIPVEAIRWE